MTYKDKTFCCVDCNNKECDRNLKHIEKLENRNLRLSVADFSKTKLCKGETKKWLK